MTRTGEIWVTLDTLHQDRTLRLRIPGHTRAAAGVTKGFDVVGLVGNLDIAAIDRHQSQATVEGLGAGARTGQGEARHLLQALEDGPRPA